MTLNPGTRRCISLYRIKEKKLFFDALCLTVGSEVERPEEKWVTVYIEAQITVIWNNIMSTTSTNSKQDNIFDCCQGHQFDRIFISGNLWSKSKNWRIISHWRSVVLLQLLCCSPWGLLNPYNKRWYRKPFNSLHSDIKHHHDIIMRIK